jgi:hypothetical protein
LGRTIRLTPLVSLRRSDLFIYVLSRTANHHSRMLSPVQR